jgi:uncharacterized protein (TIGR03435 family)
VSPKSLLTQQARILPAHGPTWRFEVRYSTLPNLIRYAWNVSFDKISGGPTWLDMDHYDIDASVPADASVENQRLMLQSLLADRLKLVVRNETRPFGTYAITAGKSVRMKPGDKSGDTGCHLVPPPGITAPPGQPYALILDQDGSIRYVCRNVTMDSFAATGANNLGAANPFGSLPLINKTGLDGAWSFELKWTLSAPAGVHDTVTIFDAFEKQLGLKLEKAEVPTPVLVIESAVETPTPNPPGLAEALPPLPAPHAFDVAAIKRSDPASRPGRTSNQNGRYVAENMPLNSFVNQAFPEALTVVNTPDWATSLHFDINAKIAAGDDLSLTGVGPLLRSMLTERFGLRYHNEERPLEAWTLVAVKPKLRKADTTARTHCAFANGSGTLIVTCQNMTLDQFAETLRGLWQGFKWPILNSTGLEGSWDFPSLTFSSRPYAASTPGRGGDAAQSADIAQASDPSGTLTIFEAVEKQLGLRLESGKRALPVVVIDHLEQAPTDN